MKPWTEEEHAYLREHYVTDGPAKCGEALGRPWRSVATRASKLRIAIRRRPWTERDDARLSVMWGVHPLAVIAKALGRSEPSVYWRAGELDLGLGCPQGHEYLSRAAVRTGYALATLRRILRWACVRIDRATVNPARLPKGTHVRHVVETTDVDDAIAAWCATETFDHAADRLGVWPPLLSRLLSEARAKGDPRATAKPKGKRHWRVDSALCDELASAYQRLETIGGAARRVGHDRRTLIQWLNAAGINFTPHMRLDPDDIDRLVAERLADPRCKARRAA